MSTRCQVQVEGSDVLIYKHSDGYPDGVIPWLAPFVARFSKLSGHRADYMSARIIVEGIATDARERAEWLATLAPDQAALFKDQNDTLGWGVDTEIHGDIAYLYVVKPGALIEVQDGNGKVLDTIDCNRPAFAPGADPFSLEA